MEDILKNMAGIEIEISGRNGKNEATVRSEYFNAEGKTQKIRMAMLTEEDVKKILSIILERRK